MDLVLINSMISNLVVQAIRKKKNLSAKRQKTPNQRALGVKNLRASSTPSLETHRFQERRRKRSKRSRKRLRSQLNLIT